MYKYFALFVALFFSQLSCALPNNSSRVEFKTVEMPFGIVQKKMNLSRENEEPENIGSLAVISNEQLSVFDSPIFASIDLSTLPPEVDELIQILNGIKSELTQSIEHLVILGDLYVHPKFRSQGYAKQLIAKTCEEIFNTTQNQYIVIVPNPFEFENNVQVSLKESPEYEEKKASLIKLYQQVGFVSCKSEPFFMYLEKPKSL